MRDWSSDGCSADLVLLLLALTGQWAAALILPMYYWGDATVTLLLRLRRGERIWQAHRSHFYQQGARRLGSHAAVAGRTALLHLQIGRASGRGRVCQYV